MSAGTLIISSVTCLVCPNEIELSANVETPTSCVITLVQAPVSKSHIRTVLSKEDVKSECLAKAQAVSTFVTDLLCPMNFCENIFYKVS